MSPNSYDSRKRDRNDSKSTKLALGTIYRAEVVRVTDFGLFVKLLGFSSHSNHRKGRENEGLVHISQIRYSDERLMSGFDSGFKTRDPVFVKLT